MNRRHGLVLAATLALGAAAGACSSDANTSGTSGTTGASTSAAPTTTADTTPSTAAPTTAVPSTTVAPSTTAAPTTVAPTVAPTTPTTAAPAGGSVLAAPTNLQYMGSPTFTMPSGYLCDGSDPGMPGWHVVDCQQMPSYQDGVTTFVARRNDDGRFGVFVFFREGAQLRSRYEAVEPAAGTWADVTVVLGDYHFDDGAEVWVGYRYAGTGGYLDLDVLDPLPGGVTFLGGLQGLDHGAVDMHPGGATVATAVYSGSDPNCCPSQMRVQEITFSADQWWINTGTLYATAAAPAVTSEF